MRKIFLCLALLYAVSTFSQPFHKQFGASGDDLIYRIVPAGNNEHFLLGSTLLNGGHQAWLMKIDSVGNIIWTNTYDFIDDELWEIAINMTILADSSMIIAGNAGEKPSYDEGQGILVKVDKGGHLIWKKYYEELSGFEDVLPEGNGFIVVGYQGNDGVILRTDSVGNEIKRTRINFSHNTNIHRIFRMANYEYLMIGRTNTLTSAFQGMFMWRVNAQDEIVWSKTFETFTYEYEFNDITELFGPSLGVHQDSTGTIWMAERIKNQVGLFSFDTLGNLISTKIFGQAEHDEWPTSLLPTQDGGWLIAGVLDIDSTFALKIKEDGKQEWLEYYGKHDKLSFGLSAGETENHFLVAGLMAQSSPLASDGWLLGVEKNGNPFPYTIHVNLHYDLVGNCMYTPEDIPLAHWFVMASDSHRNELLLTDLQGHIEYKTDAYKTVFTYINPNKKHFQLCSMKSIIYTDSAHAVKIHHNEVHRQSNCAELEVGLTQPDLIRCDTSTVFITLTNFGAKASTGSTVRFEYDPSISLVSVSENFVSDPKGIVINVPPIGIESSYRIMANVSLSCDVQLGAAHRMAARLISNNCEQPYSGPLFEASGECINDKIRFSLGNSGGGGPDAGTFYNLYVNDLPLLLNEPIILGENDAFKQLEYPADGRTWRLEVLPDTAAPGQRKLVASVEGCGLKNTGVYDVGYTNGFSAGPADVKLSEVYPTNSTGVPHDITEAMPGMLRNNYIDRLEPMEYTLRIKNTEDHIVDSVSATLNFRGMVVSTFHPIASNAQLRLTSVDNNTLQLSMDNLDLLPGEDAMVRFRVSPYDTLEPDHNGSYFGINGEAYLDDGQSFAVSPSHHYYVLDDPALYAHYADYPGNYRIFNARRDLLGWHLARDTDGRLFLAGSTDSYGDYYVFNGFVIKTDEDGKFIWQTIVKVDEISRINIQQVLPTGDGGCLFVGIYELLDNPHYDLSFGLVGRLDSTGHLTWHKIMQPAGTRTSFRNAFRSGDGNVIVIGNTRTTNFYPLILKIDLDGNIIWHKVIEQNSPRPSLFEGVELQQGGFAFFGTNENTVDYRPVIVTLNNEGSLQWIKGYPYANGASIVPTPDHGYLLLIRTTKDTLGTEHIMPRFIKVDSAGQFQWQKDVFLVGPKRMLFYELIPAYSGGYMVATDEWDTNDMVLFRLSDSLDLQWVRIFGNENDESATVVINDEEDEIWLLGHNTIRTRHDHNQTILIKTDGKGITGTKHDQNIPSKQHVLIFPNPTSETLNVLISHPSDATVKWMVVDLLGKVWKTGEGFTSNPIGVSTHDLIPGHYCIVFPGSSYPAKNFIIAR